MIIVNARRNDALSTCRDALREIASARAVPAPKGPDVDWYLFTVYLQDRAQRALVDFSPGGGDQ